MYFVLGSIEFYLSKGVDGEALDICYLENGTYCDQIGLSLSWPRVLNQGYGSQYVGYSTRSHEICISLNYIVCLYLSKMCWTTCQ